MNGKKSKRIRKLALEIFNKETKVSGKNPDQTTYYTQDERGTVGVAPVSLRFVYQKLKRHIKKEKLNEI